MMPLINDQSSFVNPWRPKSPFINILGNLCLDTRYKFLRIISIPEVI